MPSVKAGSNDSSTCFCCANPANAAPSGPAGTLTPRPAVAAGLPVSRPAVSQHLKVLLDAGLVHARPQGTRRVYAVSNAGFLKLNIWLDQFWDAEEVSTPGS